MEMAGDFSVIIEPYFWKRLKNGDDGNFYSDCLLFVIE